MPPIDAQGIDAFVRAEGEKVWHSIGTRCWCQGKNGQLDPLCKDHDVTGSVYGPQQTIVGLFTDITQRKELIATGFFLPGDAVFSPLSGYVVSEGDKITLTYPLPHGKGDALVRGMEDSETLLYAPVSPILVIDDQRRTYRFETDFLFTGKRIVWQPGGNRPDLGQQYVVKYKGYIDWIAFFPVMERFSHGKDIGQKVLLRKLHLLRGSE